MPTFEQFPIDTMLSQTLILFAFTAAVTPGPNNVMLAASGANFGFVRTLRHISGIVLGFPAMLVAIGLGLTKIFDAYPQSWVALRWIGFCYLLYLAWRIANAQTSNEKNPGTKPLGFFAAALFQWVNPKGWAVGLGALATFITPDPDSLLEQTLGIALVFMITNVPVTMIWTLFGMTLNQHLDTGNRRRIFNIVMALLLVASIVPTFFF